MEKHILYEYTWCDYLTPCPHGNDCFVGDYDCFMCKHFVNDSAQSAVNDCRKNDDYSKYTKVYQSYLICNHE